LLSTEALIEFLSGVNDPNKPGVIAWAKAKETGKLYVSEMSWALARSDAEAERSAMKRQQWLDKLDRDLPVQFGSRLIPVNRSVLLEWSLLAQESLGDGETPSIDESIEVATAQSRSLTYVTRKSALADRV